MIIMYFHERYNFRFIVGHVIMGVSIPISINSMALFKIARMTIRIIILGCLIWLHTHSGYKGLWCCSTLFPIMTWFMTIMTSALPTIIGAETPSHLWRFSIRHVLMGGIGYSSVTIIVLNLFIF